MNHLALILLPLSASLSMADLVITEVMADSRHLDTTINGDWWEITNNGSSAVNLSGYSWDDDSNTSGLQTFPAHIIQPTHSVLLLKEGAAAAIAPFRTAWGIDGSVKIFVEADFGTFPGFSGGSGDTIYLYQPNGALVDSFTFGPSTSGSSFSNFDNGNAIPGGLSILGEFNAIASSENPSDIGSPGIAPAVPPPVSPSFVAPLEVHWPAGQNASSMELLPVAVDPNPGDVITLSVIIKPDWLTISFPGDGIISFSGTPTNAEIGAHPFILQAIDDSSVTAANEQDFIFHVLPQNSPIILNEFNAVSEDFFLDGAEEGEVGAPTDPNLGQIQGNGGEWLEFVVTGSAGNDTVDLRNHLFEITGNGLMHQIQLTDHIALSEIPAGTILTLSRNYETNLNRTSNLASTGFIWSNIWFFDPVLVDLENSIFSDDPVISDLDTRVTIYNGSDTIIYGPSGESVSAIDTDLSGSPDTLVSVSDTEVFKLEQNPTSTVNPLSGNYSDGSSSTHGAPNLWGGGLSTQSFAGFTQSNSPPRLSSLPSPISIRGVYSAQIEALDPQAQGVTFTASNVPSFLTFTDIGTGSATLINNQPITASDIGTYDITIIADDGQATFNKTYHAFRLTVYNPTPAVILNEYNAVSNTNFLNGGDGNFDGDSLATTQDTFFGRAQGNGANWFELAVVGDGGPGLVDMRGWNIEIGEGQDGDRFTVGATITLTQDNFWAAIPAGSILTFIENDTAAGGLDTSLNRADELTTEGWRWSNIHLGDSSLVTLTGLIDIDSTRTQFTISDTEKTVFGPVGEGILDGVNVSSDELFNLEASPSPSTSMFDNGGLSQGAGYDDASIDSTFGSRNRYLSLAAGAKADQDFTPYILQETSFAIWSQQFPSIRTSDLNGDADSDNWTNLEEYLFGADPTDSSSMPQTIIDTSTGSITVNIRQNDPVYEFFAERSGDLQNWTDSELNNIITPSSLGFPYAGYVFSYDASEPKQFFRVKSGLSVE